MRSWSVSSKRCSPGAAYRPFRRRRSSRKAGNKGTRDQGNKKAENKRSPGGENLVFLTWQNARGELEAAPQARMLLSASRSGRRYEAAETPVFFFKQKTAYEIAEPCIGTKD